MRKCGIIDNDTLIRRSVLSIEMITIEFSEPVFLTTRYGFVHCWRPNSELMFLLLVIQPDIIIRYTKIPNYKENLNQKVPE